MILDTIDRGVIEAKATAVDLAIAASVAALAIFATPASLVLTGAGHGWISPLWTSWTSILFGPIAGVAWTYRTRTWARILARLCIGLLLAVDLFLFFLTQREGLDYVALAWRHAFDWMLLWVISWLSPHVLFILVILVRSGPKNGEKTKTAMPDSGT